MKRFWSLLIVILFVTCNVYGAEQLSELTDEELLTKYEQIAGELDRRGILEMEFPSGKYVANKDIPVGKYVVTVTFTPEDDSFSTLNVRDAKDESRYHAYVEKGNKYYFELREGDTLITVDMTGTIRQFDGFFETK